MSAQKRRKIKMPRKVLHELRIRRAKSGGHIVEHHHDADHDPESHRFKRSGAAVQHLLSYVDRLEPKGLPHTDVEEEEESQPDGGRPAGFDSGSARGGSAISARRK
jgi:hypothetical protein